jgi:protein translocase SecG subunit
MYIIHGILQVLQVFIALGLIGIVMSQTSKQSGMGGAIGGGDAPSGGSRYKGGMEEQIDNIARVLAFSFLVVSFFVAYLGRMLT